MESEDAAIKKSFIKTKRNRDTPPSRKSKSDSAGLDKEEKQKMTFPTQTEEYISLKAARAYWDDIEKEKINSLKNLPSSKFRYGNYTNFYYQRYLNTLKEKDITTSNSVFRTEWLTNKRCLDIGCNTGTLTLLISHYYNPSYIEGVDIDYSLIKTAIKTLKAQQRNSICTEVIDKESEIMDKLKQFPKTCQMTLASKGEPSKALFPNSNIIFRQENYVGELKQIKNPSTETFDTIICLGTSKWIHLNYGDIGIKVLFYNVYQQLRTGGLFIFESQRYDTYKKKVKICKTLRENYNNIKFMPQNFVDYLIKVYGMELVASVSMPSNSKKVFYRMVAVLKKN